MGCGANSGRHVNPGDLSRAETDDSAVLIVVELPSVADVAAFGVFQEKGLDAVIEDCLSGPSGGL